MYEIAVIDQTGCTIWRGGTRPEDLSVYLEPGVIFVAVYHPGASGGLGGDYDGELLDYIYAGDR